MAKKTQAGTNVGKVKQQNAGGQFGLSLQVKQTFNK